MFRVALLASCCVVAAPLVAQANPAGDDGPTVKFVHPRHLATIMGPTTLEAEVALPPGVDVEQLLFTVDGFAVVRLTAPPWKTSWNAGDAGTGYRLEVIARLSDGSEISQVIATTELRINQREAVDLVNLYPVVRDRSGRYITDLTRDDFKVYERGRVQTISSFTTERRPLRVGIVLDTSLSMAKGDKLQEAQAAALGFLESLEPGDEGMVVTFDDRVRVSQEFTANREALSDAILSATPNGGTALYDAVWRTSRMLHNLNARRVVVVLSDGRDESVSGLEAGSLHTLEEALDQALRNEVMVFAIGLGKDLDRECSRPWDRVFSSPKGCAGKSQQEVLAKLSNATGGRLMITASARRLRNAFEDVANDLRNQYSVAYSSTDTVKDGKWRAIEVTVTSRPDARVVSRDGYYATSAAQ